MLGILQSATLFATQVAFLNDDRETKFGTDLFKIVVQEEIEERAEDADAVAFFKKVLEFSADDPTSPTHGISKFFITSFSADEDSGDQWQKYGRPHGYAIGFYARGLRREPNSQIYRVVYDPKKQVQAVKQIVRGTFDFYRQGLNEERSRNPSQWAIDFYHSWDEGIYKLAPLVKDGGQWSTENEFRLVHELKLSEFPRVRFVQKGSTLARYLPLDTPSWLSTRTPILPRAKILVGPGNDKIFTNISLRLLLDQMGYRSDLPIESTKSNLVWR
jgi:hypothetical protein